MPARFTRPGRPGRSARLARTARRARTARPGRTAPNPAGLLLLTPALAGAPAACGSSGTARSCPNPSWTCPTARPASAASGTFSASPSIHPDYGDNGLFYVAYSDRNDDLRIERFSVSGDPDRADAGSAATVLRIDPPSVLHFAGFIRFVAG